MSPQRQIFHLPTQPLCFCSGYRSKGWTDMWSHCTWTIYAAWCWEPSSSSRYNKPDWDCFTEALSHPRAKGSPVIHWLHYFYCWSWGGQAELPQLVSFSLVIFFLHHLFVFIHSDRSLKVFFDHLCYASAFPTVMLQDFICSSSWDSEKTGLFNRH